MGPRPASDLCVGYRHQFVRPEILQEHGFVNPRQQLGDEALAPGWPRPRSHSRHLYRSMDGNSTPSHLPLEQWMVLLLPGFCLRSPAFRLARRQGQHGGRSVGVCKPMSDLQALPECGCAALW